MQLARHVARLEERWLHNISWNMWRGGSTLHYYCYFSIYL